MRRLMPSAFCLLLALCISSCATAPQSNTKATIPECTRSTLAILESTDTHSNVLSYDYYRLTEDPSMGFERLATLIKEARASFANTLLFDAGDTIQGSALADYQAITKRLACEQELAIYQAMDALHYDGATIGNHEFNYGLPFLSQVTHQPMNVEGVPQQACKGPGFPLVLANVFSTRDNKPIYPPYAILDRTIQAHNANGALIQVPLRVGIIGFTPPPIMLWDKRHLEGKVYTIGLVEAARQFLPELRAKNVDLVIAISHGGIDISPYSPELENGNWYLAQEPGIDVLLLGHSHTVFPDPNNAKSRFNNLPQVDNQRGFIHGKPAVMGNFWGKSLGVIELALMYQDGQWQIDTASTHSEVRHIRKADDSYVVADPHIAPLIKVAHEATLDYVTTPIGTSDFALTSYFSEVGDVAALQIINMAQRSYVKKYIDENLPQYINFPILSAAAPFKSGFAGPADYTDVPAGTLSIRSAADLYPYPNTITAVKIDGATLKAWLERAATRFNRIDPAKREPQELINRKLPGYNLDVLQGEISYLIDITQVEGQRIRDLRYRDKPVDSQQSFIVVTNNYRASGGGHFPGLDGSNIVVSAPDSNRDALITWIRSEKNLTRTQHAADHSWRFAPTKTNGPILYTSAAGKLDIAHAAGLINVQVFKDNGDGTAAYSVDLSGL